MRTWVFSPPKKPDSADSSYVTVATTSTPDKSVVQVIRSRFYGKKGKEREVDQLPYSSAPPLPTNTTSKYNGPPVNSILLPSSPPPPVANGIGASPRPSVSHRRILLQKSQESLPPLPPSTPSKKRTIEVVAPSSSGASTRSRHAPSTPSKDGDASVVLSATPQRKQADSVTVTLAHRLNELAVANAEGLLNDDEYRLLRQSLFERFANASVVPQEEPIVPAARPRPRKSNVNPDGRPASRPISNFQVELPRPTSIHSRNSMSFGDGVADLIRRATGRSTSSATKDSDASSIWSAKSSSSKIFRFRSISKKSSNSSIGTTTSRAQADSISISSKRAAPGGSDKGHSDHGHHFSPSGSRSGSIRKKLQTPPSSFPTRIIGQDARYATNIRDVFDEENLKSAQDIQKEIQAVEAEQRRLMDAFNGLELTTLSKMRRQHQARPSLKSATGSQGESSQNHSDTRSHKRFNPSESDAVSIRSGVSVGTAPSVAPSMARSAYSNRSKTLRGKSSLNPSVLLPSSSLPSPASLHRKNSSSSFTSMDRRIDRSQIGPPPVPALPATISHGHLRAANNSSISLIRSTGHLPMDVVHEDDDKLEGKTDDALQVEDEMEEIRRRREEVALRYEARLDYLRAKLKGAQLHEKLLKK
ncbi:hypothetical protein CC2G_012963 [Coprinopsis cinerea AmutBmut pab1-1]|nr:hypothetical protein CC2G_012963 [Coprinopsis cinerea AmutBmut pab1-1]